MEDYWKKFARSGAVRDYLEYRGMEMRAGDTETCESSLRAVGEAGVKKRGADNSDRDGTCDHPRG